MKARNSQGDQKLDIFELPGVPDVAQLKDLLTDQLAKARSESDRHWIEHLEPTGIRRTAPILENSLAAPIS